MDTNDTDVFDDGPDAAMGTTGTPGGAGADRVLDDDTPTGAAAGVDTGELGFGGRADRPGTPFDRMPGPDDDVDRGLDRV